MAFGVGKIVHSGRATATKVPAFGSLRPKRQMADHRPGFWCLRLIKKIPASLS